MASKMLGIRLARGERVRLETPGGGGYGDPARRSETARRHDRAMGYVTQADDASNGGNATQGKEQQA
jgi:N-methylhydantoinase B